MPQGLNQPIRMQPKTGGNLLHVCLTQDFKPSSEAFVAGFYLLQDTVTRSILV